MSVPEMAARMRDATVRQIWRGHRLGHGAEKEQPRMVGRVGFRYPLPRSASAAVPLAARDRLLASAEHLMAGHWPVFVTWRHDLESTLDWFHDPRSGRRAPSKEYCFDVSHRDVHAVGNVKYVWELSRHHHLTLLAAAYYLTAEPRYARRVSEHLASWWEENPFLTGVHWTSGLELGLRLIAWVWIRRLLDEWEGASALFEQNPVFLRQLADHQRYLAAFPSHHSSANNHRIGEAAGLFVAAAAFPYFADSSRWRRTAADTLRREAERQTFPCGLNRELATGYHGFVLELLLAALLEGEAAACPLGPEAWDVARRMSDALAAIVDSRLQPPRQGDSDDGCALLLDPPDYRRWPALLATGARLFGRLDWWPRIESEDVRTALWTALARAPAPVGGPRPAKRPSLFSAAGVVLLRDGAQAQEEIWCRCDHGPLGFLALAAHGHSDALALEVRYDGVDVLADPGTYDYHGEPGWRDYFRSTRAHNTLQVNGTDQAAPVGPFIWGRHPRSRLLYVDGLDGDGPAVWRAEHDGFRRLRSSATHRRTVTLNRASRCLTVEDELDAINVPTITLAYHLGPRIDCLLAGAVADLTWTGDRGPRGARLELPSALAWEAVIGRTEPPLGWYSPRFGEKEPSCTLVGTGVLGEEARLVTRLRFDHACTADGEP